MVGGAAGEVVTTIRETVATQTEVVVAVDIITTATTVIIMTIAEGGVGAITADTGATVVMVVTEATAVIVVVVEVAEATATIITVREKLVQAAKANHEILPLVRACNISTHFIFSRQRKFLFPLLFRITRPTTQVKVTSAHRRQTGQRPFRVDAQRCYLRHG